MKFFSLILFSLFSFNVFANGLLPIANIIKIHGDALVGKEAIHEGMEVTQGMEISIPKKGDYIILKFQNGHKVRFTEAIVKVEELTQKSTLFTLLKGQIHTFVSKLTPDEKFIVKTKDASFAVRGTKFSVSLDDKKNQAYLCVCEGVVNTSRGEMSVDVKKKQDLWINLDNKRLIVEDSAERMQNMTNQIIDEMNKL